MKFLDFGISGCPCILVCPAVWASKLFSDFLCFFSALCISVLRALGDHRDPKVSKVWPQHSLQQLRGHLWVLTAKSLSLLNYFLPRPTPPKRSISEWENSGGIAVVGRWDQGLSDGKGNIYLARIKHCMLALLVRTFTHKFIIQSKGGKEKEWEGRCFVFVTNLQWFLTVLLSVLSLQLCDMSYLLLLIPGILFGDFTWY